MKLTRHNKRSSQYLNRQWQRRKKQEKVSLNKSAENNKQILSQNVYALSCFTFRTGRTSVSTKHKNRWFYLSNRAFMKVFSSNSVTKSFWISKHILVNLISSSQVLVYVIFLPSSRQLRHCGKYRNVKNLSFCL